MLTRLHQQAAPSLGASGPVRPKNDHLERQAEAIADRLSRDPEFPELGPAGRPASGALSPSQRRFFDSRLGHDLSKVRVHAGPDDRQKAEVLGARAFARDGHLHFDPGCLPADGLEGRWTFAHEMAHAAQQRAAVVPAGSIQREPPPKQPEPSAEEKRYKAAVERVAGIDAAIAEHRLGSR